MGDAKKLIVKPISSKDANRVIKSLHYSGKVVANSQLHFGVFMDGKCGGAMSFGCSLDKRKTQGLVRDTGWNDFLELNRMAFADWLPKNGESRCIGYAMRYIKKHYPHIEWIISFADGTQCGDGTIYRASGFNLTQINKSMNLVRRGDGEVIHKMTLESNPTKPRKELGGKSYYDITGGKYDLMAYSVATNGEVIPGFQLRYIYFLNPEAKKRITVPILPFSKIDEMGAGMYKGKQRIQCVSSETRDTPDIQSGKGGATPTDTLQFKRASSETIDTPDLQSGKGGEIPTDALQFKVASDAD